MAVSGTRGRVRVFVWGPLAALGAGLSMPARGQKQYDSGASDTEIVIGNLMPYSGPASAYGVVGRALAAYFDKVNAEEGGVNGRRIRFISLDDGYSPPRAVEQARKLVEHDQVLFITQVLGTPSNAAIQRYLNQRKVPQLFAASGATRWGDPAAFPWTMGWQPSYQSEAKIVAAHILDTRPAARIAVLYQNDDYGRDYLKGFREGLSERARSMVIAEASYEVSDPTVDSQMLSLKASGADTFFNITTAKFAAQSIRKAAEIGWKPQHYLNSVSSGVASVMTPAGLNNGVGIITAAYTKDPTDPQWAGSPEIEAWQAWMRRYHPGGDLRDNLNVYGYSVAQTVVQVLRQCGDRLTRDNIMKQATSLDMSLPMLLPGVKVRTASDDYFPIESAQLMRFNGRGWERFGPVYGR